MSNLLKIVPGVGTRIGGALSRSTAAILTTTLGEAYIAVMTAMYNGELNEKDLETQKGQDKLRKLFKKEVLKLLEETYGGSIDLLPVITYSVRAKEISSQRKSDRRKL